MSIYSPTGSQPTSTSAGNTPPGLPTVKRVSIVAANTEQSEALPTSLKAIQILNRGRTVLRIAYTVGGTNSTAYHTLNPRGGIGTPEIFVAAASTIYFQTARAGDVVELITYT